MYVVANKIFMYSHNDYRCIYIYHSEYLFKIDLYLPASISQDCIHILRINEKDRSCLLNV